MSAQSESKEKLSALFDGELRGAELDQLLVELESSPELSARWQRLCSVEAARKGVMVARNIDITAGVMAAIADAPAPAYDTRVVALPQRPARSARREWLPAVGLAAAASLVAAVAVTSFRARVAAPETQPVAVAPSAAAFQPVAAAAGTRLDDDAARQLDSLVIEHANYRGGGVGGALGYARVAAHTADYQIVDGQH